MANLKYAKDMIEKLKSPLGLSDWYIDIIEEDLKDGVGAFVRYIQYRQLILIVVDKSIQDEETMLRAILHELLHVLIDNNREKIMDLLDSLLELPQGEEIIVEGLAKAVVDYSRVIKGGKDGISNNSNIE